MIHREQLPNGRYVTITTRRANYATQIFGKGTLWKSKSAYQSGDCDGAIAISNYYLTDDPNLLPFAIQKFIQVLTSRDREHL